MLTERDSMSLTCRTKAFPLTSFHERPPIAYLRWLQVGDARRERLSHALAVSAVDVILVRCRRVARAVLIAIFQLADVVVVCKEWRRGVTMGVVSG